MSSSTTELPRRAGASAPAPRWRWPWAAPQTLWWGPAGLFHAGTSAGQPQPWDALERWCEAHPGTRAGITLSAWWLTDVQVDDSLPVQGDAALLAYARPLLVHYHGDPAASWPLAAWQAGAARGVSALHGLDLAALQATAARHGVQLAGVQPWWARALRHLLPRQPTLARAPAAQVMLVEGRMLTRLDLARGRLCALQQRRLHAATPAALAAWLAECRDEQPQAVQHCLGYGLSGDVPEGQTPLPGDCPPAASWVDAPW